MTTGEKIKYFRNMRGISQETLGQLSGINSATIKKYEYGIRNPKPDQLLKIANALGISINIFMDFDIETVSDVLSLLFKLDDQIDMKFEADKDEEGNFKPATVKLSFKNNLINKKLCTYMKALEIRENMINAKNEYSEAEYADSLQHINENIEEIKQHLLDDSMVCFLQALFGQSCKTFLDIIASPNWTKLQSLDWQPSCQPHSHCRPYLVVTA